MLESETKPNMWLNILVGPVAKIADMTNILKFVISKQLKIFQKTLC